MFKFLQRRKHVEKPEKKVQELPLTEPATSSLASLRINFIRSWLSERFDHSPSVFNIKKLSESKFSVRDPNGDPVAIFNWKDGSEDPEISQYTTPWIVGQNNQRLAYSCAIVLGSEISSDGSMEGNLRRGRAKFAGQMSTN